MTDERKEIKLVGDQPIPADILVYKDPVYGERVFTRDGFKYTEQTKEPLQPIRTHADRTYVMHDSTSFIAAVIKYGDDKKGIIFYELAFSQAEKSGAVTMFFDEDSRKERINLPLTRSLEFRNFLNGPEKTFNQKAFLKLIDTFPECISGGVGTLRPMIEKIQLSTEIEFESNLDSDNLTFIYKEKTGGNQTGTLPKKLALSLPFFEGSENKISIEADLEVTMPKEEGAKPTFKLVNVKHERTEREALTAEINSLQTKLTGWQFVNGKF